MNAPVKSAGQLFFEAQYPSGWWHVRRGPLKWHELAPHMRERFTEDANAVAAAFVAHNVLQFAEVPRIPVPKPVPVPLKDAVVTLKSTEYRPGLSGPSTTLNLSVELPGRDLLLAAHLTAGRYKLAVVPDPAELEKAAKACEETAAEFRKLATT